MIRRILFTFLLSGLILGTVSGQSKVEQLVFDKANQLYLNSDFSGARDEYQKIVSSGFESAELYFNLGNTYYKLGQIPSAILFYERALLLNPKDEDIRFNLDLVNRLVVDKLNPVNEFFMKKWVRAAAGILKADTWGVIAIISFLLLLSLILLTYATRNNRYGQLIIPGGSVLAFLLVVSLFLGTVENRQTNHAGGAIVFATSLTAKSSPEQGGTDLFVIHEGLKVRINGQVGNWLRIRLADGNEGWVPESSVERI